MTEYLEPTDENFGNKPIEDKGRDLLSDRLFPQEQADTFEADFDRDTLGDFAESEPEPAFDPDDPAACEQRRLLSLNYASQFANEDVDALISNATKIYAYLRNAEGADPSPADPGAPTAL